MSADVTIDIAEIVELELVHLRAGDIVLDESRNTRSYAAGGSGIETKGTAEEHDAFTDEQLRRDIEIRGVLQPITVEPLDDDDDNSGRFAATIGFRRLRACLAISEDYPVPSLVRRPRGDDADEQAFDRAGANLAENMHRRKLKPFELAEALYRMRQLRPEISKRELGEFVGLSDGYTCNLLKIRTCATPELWRLFVDYGLRFSSRVSYIDLLEIVKLPQHEQVAAWHALLAEKEARKTRHKKARRANAATLRKWLKQVDHIQGSGDYRAGLRAALLAAMGETPWNQEHEKSA